MLQPLLVKGNIQINLEDGPVSFLHQSISIYGANGLPWGRLSSERLIGKDVEVVLKAPASDPVELRATARINREHSSAGEQMALKFALNPEQQDVLRKIIRNHGFYPTEYIRKYPRIPVDSSIGTFPLHLLGFPSSSQRNRIDQTDEIIFEVRNLSPNGVLLATENPFASSIVPSERLKLIFDPRGNFPVRIVVEGMVCRVIEEISSKSKNVVRLFGIKFLSVEGEDRGAFLDLLKDILAKMKSRL